MILDPFISKHFGEELSASYLPRLFTEWGLKFKNPALAVEALTHSSFVHEHSSKSGISNERLEFLGDSVLGLAVSETLMRRGQRWTEGELSRLKSHFVSEPALAEKARKVGLGNCLRLGKGERMSGGAERESALADTVEAIIGAIFLDQGFQAATELVQTKILPELSLDSAEWENLASSLLEKDVKSRLQEFFQQQGLGTPRYVCTNSAQASSTGPFEMALYLGEVVLDKEMAASKREATQLIARRLLAMAPPDLVGFVATQMKQKGFMTSGAST